MRPLRCPILLAFCLGLVPGCGESSGPASWQRLPDRFYFVAEAVNGDSIDCWISYIYQVTGQENDGAFYEGSFGGEAYRAHLQEDGSGEVFWADAAGPFVIEIGAGGTIEVKWGPGISPSGDSRFWDGQALFTGKMGEDGYLAAGDWSCEPLDTRSDTTGFADGRWRIQPNPPPPCETCIP